MKNCNVLLVVGLILMSAAILFSGCKKKEDPVILPPSITVTATYDGTTVEFNCYCVADDLNLTKVDLIDPSGSTGSVPFGELWPKNTKFWITIDDNPQPIGKWTLTFTGTVAADGRSFSVTVTVNVTEN